MDIKEALHAPNRLAVRHAADILNKLASGSPLARIEALGPTLDLSDLLRHNPQDQPLRRAVRQLHQIAQGQVPDAVSTAQAAVLAQHVRRLAEEL